ncbi:MAG: phosphoenolpyruvate carboxykinase domain-containing protein, partial [Actinomycetota bacterium]|nr:phosphoenolpyruvate carboxykinase domain-containing protein [Actinomycetota bacterium]
RCAGKGAAVESPIGMIPAPDAIPIEGLDLRGEAMAQLLAVDNDEWTAEVPLIAEHFDGLGERLPAELRTELTNLEKRLR